MIPPADIVATAARWEIVLTLALGVLTLFGVIGRITWKTFQFMDRQIDALEHNTKAVELLSQRILKLELTQKQTVRAMENGEGA